MATLHAAMVALALSSGDAVLLDFYADWCGPCREMTPVVERLKAAGYPVRKVNLDHERELASRF
jgi:thioredoxin 1